MKKNLWGLVVSVFFIFLISCSTQANDKSTFVSNDSVPSIADSTTSSNSWIAGDNVKVTLDENVLTVSGNGAMYNKYNYSKPAPWIELCKNDTKLIIENGVTSIAPYAFKGCNLVGNLKIPESVTDIGISAFDSCIGLNGDLKIPNSVTNIGSCAFYGCSGFTGNLIISNKVTTIESSTFYGCSGFTGELNIPFLVTNIEKSAFAGCSKLNGELVLPSGLLSIGVGAFQDCSKLTGDLILPSSIKSIEKSAFVGCSGFTGSLILPSNLKNISDYTFWGCSGLTGDLNIPFGVNTIGKYAFSGCRGFNGKLILPSSVNVIEDSAFSNCKNLMENLEIPSGVTSIGSNAFSGCNSLIGSLNLPSSVTKIGAGAFQYCRGLKDDLVIPSSVKDIGTHAFFGCSGLTRVINNSNVEVQLKDLSSSEWYNGYGELVTSIINGQAYRSDYVKPVKDLEIKAEVTSDSTFIGNTIKIFANVTGGSGEYTYKFIVYNKDTDEWGLLQDFNPNNSFSWTAGSVGNRDFYVDVKDSTGKVLRSEALKVTVWDNTLSLDVQISKTSIQIGDKVIISASAKGGSKKYTYKFIVYNKDTDAWALLKNFSEESSFTWIAQSGGRREFYVDVKDSMGKVVRSIPLNVNTNSNELGISVEASANSTKLGEEVYFTAVGIGGSGNYTYKFIVHNKDTDTWALLQDFSESNNFTWTAVSLGNREFYVDIKDSTGKVIRSRVINVVTNNNNTPLEVSVKISGTGDKIGDIVDFSAIATGGEERYSYKFIVYNRNTAEWALLQNFSENNTFEWMSQSVGDREFYVDVKDNTGKVVRSKMINVITRDTDLL